MFDMLIMACILYIAGFGGRTPKSTWGKLGTIIYAILGIPLMLLYLTNLGDIFARGFTACYIKICTRRSKSEKRQKLQKEIYRAHYMTGNGKVSKSSACKYSNRDLFTDRQHDPYRTAKHIKECDLKHFALSSNSSEVDSPRHVAQRGEEIQLERIPDEIDMSSSKISLTNSNQQNAPAIGPFPIILCLFILLSYVLGGAAVFSYLEGWSYIEGIYFSFVTLTTIGFGDLVPGRKSRSEGGVNIAQIVYATYLLIGMAIIAMCFNLIQDLLVASSKYNSSGSGNKHSANGPIY